MAKVKNNRIWPVSLPGFFLLLFWLFIPFTAIDFQSEEKPGTEMSMATNRSSLILIDLFDGKWVDMKTTGSYAFTHREGRQFRIIYNREGEIRPGVTLLGRRIRIRLYQRLPFRF